MMGNYHVPFWRAVGVVTLSLTLIARSYSGDNDGAIADFTRCTQIAPSASDYYNLGVSQATHALYPSALASLSKSLTQHPEIATYYARSVTLAALGDEFGASRDYSEALAASYLLPLTSYLLPLASPQSIG
jgi:tetratricopeptide (TPR) repeat protein